MNNTDTYTTDAPSYEDAVNASRRVPPTTHELTPYLGLRARLSQVWFNRWTLLLFLVLVRVILATQSLDGDLRSARREALSACTGVESMGSAMASMPHYMSRGVNEVAAMGIETAVKALEKTLLLLITGVQEIVVFVVNMITSTYVCLITLAIQGSLGAVLDATEKIADFVNNTMGKIFDDVGKDVKSVQDGINKVAKALEKLPNFFGPDLSLPVAKFPSLDELKKVQIPTTFDDDLKKLKDGIPTFDEVQKAAHDAIRIPFRLISVCPIPLLNPPPPPPRARSLTMNRKKSMSPLACTNSIVPYSPSPRRRNLPFALTIPKSTTFLMAWRAPSTRSRRSSLGSLSA